MRPRLLLPLLYLPFIAFAQDATYAGDAAPGQQTKRFIQPASPKNYAPDGDVKISVEVPVALGTRTANGDIVTQDTVKVKSSRGSTAPFIFSEAGGPLGGLNGQAEGRREAEEKAHHEGRPQEGRRKSLRRSPKAPTAPKVQSLSYRPPPPPVRREIVMAPRCSFDTDAWAFHPESAVTEAVMFERTTGLTCEQCLHRCTLRQSGPWTCRSLTYDSNWKICDLFAVKANGAPYNLVDYSGRDYFEYNAALPPTDDELNLVNEFDVSQKSTAATTVVNCEVKTLQTNSSISSQRKLAGVTTLTEKGRAKMLEKSEKRKDVEHATSSAMAHSETSSSSSSSSLARMETAKAYGASNLREELNEFDLGDAIEAAVRKTKGQEEDENNEELSREKTRTEIRQEELARIPKVKNNVHLNRKLSERDLKEGRRAAKQFNQRSTDVSREEERKRQRTKEAREKVALKARERAEAAEARARAEFELLERERQEELKRQEEAAHSESLQTVKKVVKKKKTVEKKEFTTKTERKFVESNGEISEDKSFASSSSSSSSRTSSTHRGDRDGQRVRVHASRTLHKDSGHSRANSLESKLKKEAENINTRQPVHEEHEEQKEEKIRGGKRLSKLHTKLDTESKNEKGVREKSSAFAGEFSEQSETSKAGVHRTSSRQSEVKRLRHSRKSSRKMNGGHFCHSADQKPVFVQFVQTETPAKAETPRVAASRDDCIAECHGDSKCASAVFSPAGCHVSTKVAKYGGEADLQPSIHSTFFHKSCLPSEFVLSERRVFVAVQNQILVGHVEEVEDATSLDDCIGLCLNSRKRHNFSCLSVMFYPNDKDQNCLLNRESRLTNPQTFVAEEAGVQMIYVDMQPEEEAARPLRSNGDFRQKDDPLDAPTVSVEWTKWSKCDGKKENEMHFRYLKCQEKDVRKCPKESAFCGGVHGGPRVQKLADSPPCVAALDPRGKKRCPHGVRQLPSGEREYCSNPRDC